MMQNKQIDKKKGYIELAIQFIKFGIVGVSNTLIGLAIYYLLVYLGVNYIIANTAGFIISVLNAYYWNNKYVFKSSSKNVIKSILKCYVSYGFTFVLGTVLLLLMVEKIGISDKIAPLINLCITIPINFVVNKFWTFK